MQWPGTDLLGTFHLLGHEAYGGPRDDGEGLWPSPDGAETHMLLQLRQAASIANQLAKERVMNEAWGVGGNDSTPADFLRIGRWLAVHGVNLVVPHLSLMTIRGIRKTDCPQTFSEHSAWFDHLRPVMDELARLSWVGSRGRVENRVLVLDPGTTGFCLARRGDDLPLDLLGGFVDDGDIAARERATFGPLQRDFGRLVQTLSDRQVDFDIGDEYIVGESGRVDERVLGVGVQRYGLVVWPEHMTNVRAETAALLTEYLVAGGTIIGFRPESVTVNGRPSTVVDDWVARFPTRWSWVESRESLVDEIAMTFPPRVRFALPPPVGLAHMRRVTDDGELIIVVNSSPAMLDSTFEVDGDLTRRYELDPQTGECHSLDDRLVLAPRAATVIWLTDRDVETTPRVTVPIGQAVPLGVTAVTRSAPNVLVLDSCEMQLGDRVFPPESVYEATKRLGVAHGLSTHGWATIQYRDQIVARNAGMSPDSGGTATYRFSVAARVDTSGVRLAIETPELWDVSVNGQRVDFAQSERWLDVRIRAAHVGPLLREGENVVTLRGVPFDVRMEVHQIYLLGDFACEAADQGFRIVPETPLEIGSWQSQGHPFYDRDVVYDVAFPDGSRHGVIRLANDDWAGSVVVVEQDGAVVARLLEAPFEAVIDLEAGRSVRLRVVGLPVNLLGPWHAPNRRKGWSGEPSFWLGPDVRPIPEPGAAYDLVDLGLLKPPTWVEA
jgi:hypothetical protein